MYIYGYTIFRMGYHIRTKRLVRVIVVLFVVLFYTEFLHYYIVLLTCTWPNVQQTGKPASHPLRAMFIGDTHILGSDAHWLDKLRRYRGTLELQL